MSHFTPDQGTEQHSSLDVEALRPRQPTGLRRFTKRDSKGCLSYFIPFWFLWIPTVLMITILLISWFPICTLAGGRFIITVVTNRWATEATEEMDAAHLWASMLAGFFFSLFVITGFLVKESDWWEAHKKAFPHWILEPEYVYGQIFSAGLVSCALGGAIYGEKDDRISGIQLVLEYCSCLAAFGMALFLTTMFFMWLNSLCIRRQGSSSIPR